MKDAVGMSERRFRVAVLLSGTGRTLENLLACRERGELDVDIPAVISTRARARGLDIARDAGIEAHAIRHQDAPDPAELSDRVKEILDPHQVDLIALAGFLRQLEVRPEWEGRIVNIHPALLPLFGGHGMYGERVHAAVLESGMKVSGCTVHFVNAEYDAGPIILQQCVPVETGDTPATLAARVFAAECRAYPEAIRLIAAGRVRTDGRRAWITSGDGE